MKTTSIFIVMIGFFLWTGVNFADEPMSLSSTVDPRVVSNNVIGYDGVWFLGFNLRRQIFQDKQGEELRRSIIAGVERDYLAGKIMGTPVVPDSIIPPGMAGYIPGLIKGPVAVTESTVASANERLKSSLILLYTDGAKTEKIARKIRQDLQKIGITIVPVTVNYAERFEFENKLQAGAYDLFLMGYKTAEGSAQELLTELFSSNGKANFFGLKDNELDILMNDLLKQSPSEKVYNEIQRKVWEKQIILPIFYIEKIEG